MSDRMANDYDLRKLANMQITSEIEEPTPPLYNIKAVVTQTGLKPDTIRRLEALPRGMGVMADDLLAAVYAHIVVKVMTWLV